MKAQFWENNTLIFGMPYILSVPIRIFGSYPKQLQIRQRVIIICLLIENKILVHCAYYAFASLRADRLQHSGT